MAARQLYCVPEPERLEVARSDGVLSFEWLAPPLALVQGSQLGVVVWLWIESWWQPPSFLLPSEEK